MSTDPVLSAVPRKTVSAVIDAWKAIDLDGKRTWLDSQATDITNNVEQSLQERKRLAEETKHFRKLSNEEKVAKLGPLMKLYQDEIDRLTKRSKTSEGYFLALYQLLATAPDPVQAFASKPEEDKSARVAELEAENKRLLRDLDSFRKEFQEIQNQEVTIRRLEEKLRDYDSKLEETIEVRVRATETHLKDEHQRNIDLYNEREQELKHQLQQLQQELSSLQHSHDVTQSRTLELNSKYDEELAAKSSEIEMLMSELDTTSSKALMLERENARLRESLDSKQTGPVLSPELEMELAQKDIKIAQLNDQLENLEQALSKETASHKYDNASLSEQLLTERKKVESLTQQIQVMPNLQEYQELKNELALLKSLEYSVDGTDNSEKTIEKLLRDKNKHLETEIMRYKASLMEREEELGTLVKQVEELQKAGMEQKQLIEKLEDDLTKGLTTQSPKISPHATTLAANNPADKPRGEDNSMIQIVCSQRDRFKTRMLELEGEVQRFTERLAACKNENESLKQDNVKLYEKIKYLQSFPNIQKSETRRDIEAGTRQEDGLEVKYKKMYEDTVNPFVIFNRKEKYQRYKELNAAEKVILRGGRFFLSNKYSRTFLFFYSLALHVLVFLTVYSMANTTACPPQSTSNI